MQQFRQHINKQIELNSGKNLFAQRNGLFRFMVLPDSAMRNFKAITKNEENHYHNLRRWLAETNPFALKLFAGKTEIYVENHTDKYN